MQGILLVKESDFKTGSSLVGSVLAQAAANLDKTTITQAADAPACNGRATAGSQSTDCFSILPTTAGLKEFRTAV
jgi:hypothetical protein